MPLFTFLVEDNKTIRDNLIPALEDLASACILGFAERETSAHGLTRRGRSAAACRILGRDRMS